MPGVFSPWPLSINIFIFVGFYVGYTFDFKVQVFNQWSGGLDGFFAPVVSQLIQHQFQPGLELPLPVVESVHVGIAAKAKTDAMDAMERAPGE